jgi:hypothetical protein
VKIGRAEGRGRRFSCHGGGPQGHEHFLGNRFADPDVGDRCWMWSADGAAARYLWVTGSVLRFCFWKVASRYPCSRTVGARVRGRYRGRLGWAWAWLPWAGVGWPHSRGRMPRACPGCVSYGIHRHAHPNRPRHRPRTLSPAVREQGQREATFQKQNLSTLPVTQRYLAGSGGHGAGARRAPRRRAA